MTQLELARQGVITPEMVRVAIRENATSDRCPTFSRFDRRDVTHLNLKTGRSERLHVYTLPEQPVLPGGFVIAYDPGDRRPHIQRCIDAFEDDLYAPRRNYFPTLSRQARIT